MATPLFSQNSIYKKYSNVWTNTEERLTKIGIAFYDKYVVQEGDIAYIVLPQEEYRPDILSQKFYNAPDLDWIICIANGIKDPLQELVAGRQIIIPNPERIGSLS